jgi:hypothetical protein
MNENDPYPPRSLMINLDLSLLLLHSRVLSAPQLFLTSL